MRYDEIYGSWSPTYLDFAFFTTRSAKLVVWRSPCFGFVVVVMMSFVVDDDDDAVDDDVVV